MTHLVDELIDLLAKGASEAVGPAAGNVGLVALGGYGRRELALRSDIDLLFLVDEEGRHSGAFVEAVLYGLWDLGFEVGQSVRTPSASIEWAEADQSVLSSLLDARLLDSGAGAWLAWREAFQVVERGVDELVSRPEVARDLVSAKLGEGNRRRERYGETVYLLEPNVKESAGGLRDLHVAQWVARVRFKTHGIDELLRLGVLSPEEHRTLRRAYDFLLRVRFELHRITRRRQDCLRFEHQERIAEILGYVARGEPDHDRRKHGVERFMRAYYYHARNIRVLGSAIVERATRGRPSRGKNGHPAPGGFRQWSGMLTVGGADHFVKDPSAMVRIFEVAQAEALEVHPYAKHLLFEHRTLLDREWRRDRRVVEPFLSLLEDPKYDASTLEQMHDCGLLKQIIPELGRVTGRWQHSLYHVYTVDVHALRVLDYAKKIRRGDLREALPALTRMLEDLPRPVVLYLACLLHDVGKGWPREDHSQRGAKVARAVGERFEAAGSPGWGPEETSDLIWLVEDHLLMSDLSQRRDVSDPRLVAQFAETVRTEERLEMLYLLTVPDMMGTSPKVWTSWKAALLRELYVNTRAALRSDEGEGARRHLSARRDRARQTLLAEIGDDAPAQAEARAFFSAVPDRYLLAVSTAHMGRHMRMWSSVRRNGGLATHVMHLRREGVSKLTVVCPDRRGLLALIAGVLAANDLSILSASVFSVEALVEPGPPELKRGASSGNGERSRAPRPEARERDPGGVEHIPGPTDRTIALDVLYVTDARGEICHDSDRWDRVRRDLERILVHGVDADPLILPRVWRPAGLRPHRPAVKTEVELVDGVGDEVVIDVFCEDHVGILFIIARTLAGLGLAITLAKISTQGHRVADGFYVCDAETGEKVTDRARLDEAVRALREALSEAPTEPPPLMSLAVAR